jgi:hypothetical protein
MVILFAGSDLISFTITIWVYHIRNPILQGRVHLKNSASAQKFPIAEALSSSSGAEIEISSVIPFSPPTGVSLKIPIAMWTDLIDPPYPTMRFGLSNILIYRANRKRRSLNRARLLFQVGSELLDVRLGVGDKGHRRVVGRAAVSAEDKGGPAPAAAKQTPKSEGILLCRDQIRSLLKAEECHGRVFLDENEEFAYHPDGLRQVDTIG